MRTLPIDGRLEYDLAAVHLPLPSSGHVQVCSPLSSAAWVEWLGPFEQKASPNDCWLVASLFRLPRIETPSSIIVTPSVTNPAS